ncbi:MAG: hypothetical protein H7A38_03390 [Chlamydiales bacterium]|nr:hypothetical protein [Chlamydiales bacterium]
MDSVESYSSAGMPVAMEMDIAWESSSSVEKLQQIAGKLLGGERLAVQEKVFLAEASKAQQSTKSWLSSFVMTPEDQPSVEKIHRLRGQILGGTKVQSVSELLRMLRSKTSLSQRELAGISQALLDCQVETPHLEMLKSKLEGKVAARDTIASALMEYNQAELPQKHRAGEVVARFRHENDAYGIEREVTVEFGPHGNLVLMDGPAMMMDSTPYQTLSSEQIRQLKALYEQMSKPLYFNNLGILLEYAHAVRSKREEVALGNVYEEFHPNLSSLIEKYRSGKCGILADSFAERAHRELGIDVLTVSHFTENFWTVLPIPGSSDTPLKWNRFSQELRGFDHTDGVVFYRDETGAERAIKFACSLEKDHPNEVTDYVSISHYKMMNQGYDAYPLNQGRDYSTVTKAFLKGSYKAVMIKDENTILGIDFLRGNVYMNRGWSSKLEDVPTDQNGFVSIPLTSLSRPDEKGIYYLNGKPIEMTHREALRGILAKAAGEFTIPPDMEEGLIELAKLAPRLLEELFMEPIPFIRENYEALQKIGKMMSEARPSITDEYDREKDLYYRELLEDYGPLCDAIGKGDYDIARQYMEKLQARLSSPASSG